MTLRFLSLRNKILIFSSLLVLIPGAILGVIAEKSGRESLKEVIGRELAREAGHTADRLSTLLRVERETLHSFSQQEFMREIRFFDLDKRISQSLKTLKGGAQSRLGYIVVNEDGLVVAATSPGWIEHPPKWTGSEVVEQATGGVLADPPGADGLLIATEIRDPDDPERRLGTLLGLLGWSLLTDVCDEVRGELSEQGLAAEIALMGADERLLKRSRTDEGASVAEDEIDALLRLGLGSSGYVVDTDAGWIAGRSTIATDSTDWRLLVIEPLSRALAPATRLRNRLLVTMAAALTIALALAAYGARRVVRPLSELTGAIEELTRGESLGVVVPVRSEDEVGTLAKAFNQMISDLGQTQEQLVEAEKFGLVGQLAAGVAHEVRTSLGVLRSSAQILGRSVDGAADPGTREMVEMIGAEVLRLSGVVDDLLTLGRQRPLDIRSVRLSAPIQAAIDFVTPQAGEKEVSIEWVVPGNDPRVACDREAIQQVCVNLLSNAIAALDPGCCIVVEIEPESHDTASFLVRDNGRGVPPALRSRVFEPFVTGRDSGVGLGLTFVKRMIHEHRGTVELVEMESPGACFRVGLPVAKENG